MSIAELTSDEAAVCDPTARRWTRDEYYQLYDAGLFQGQRVQLIYGEILKMSPMRTPHATATALVDRALQKSFGDEFWVRNQLPLYLSEDSEPEPDAAVVAGSPRDYLDDHPRTALLVVEVSESTLRFDRRVKRRLYAAAEIAEYWIVNLNARQLEVFRQPTGGEYTDSTTLTDQDEITPLTASKPVRVADLLP